MKPKAFLAAIAALNATACSGSGSVTGVTPELSTQSAAQGLNISPDLLSLSSPKISEVTLPPGAVSRIEPAVEFGPDRTRNCLQRRVNDSVGHGYPLWPFAWDATMTN